MKRIVVALLCFMPMLASAQIANLKDLFNNPDLTPVFLGCEWTQVKVINDPGARPGLLVGKTFQDINDLLLKESVKKYDVKGAFHQNSMLNETASVNQRISMIDSTKIMSTNEADATRLKAEDIQTVVSGINPRGNNKGLGIVFVIEALDKGNKEVALWCTVVDLSNMKVLMTQRVVGKTGYAFGERNYWAGGIHSCIEKIGDNFKSWKKQYQ
jgi:hypothetical protein